jgi:hypothetical protein
MNPLRLAATLAVLSAAAAVFPVAAPAATLDYTAGSGPDPGEYIVYSAGKGERNRLTVIEGKQTLTFSDPGAKRITKKKGSFRGCVFTNPKRVVCNVDPTIDLDVRLGDGDDKLSFVGKKNATRYGPTSPTRAASANALAEHYIDYQGANTEHLRVSGGTGDDKLNGTRYHDVFDPGPGRDTVDGGGGRDTINDSPDGAPDELLGGRGLDTIDGQGGTPLAIDLADQTVRAGEETDGLNSVEIAHGGDGDDKLFGSSGRDGLYGDDGNDELDGRLGDDYVSGDLESLYDSYASGNDTISGGAGNDILDGREDPFPGDLPMGAGELRADRLLCGDGVDVVVARTDDTTDPSCESSAFGTFTGGLYFEQDVDPRTTAGLWPVARGADRAPTYSIACPKLRFGTEKCEGRLQLEDPPVDASTETPRILGTAEFKIAQGARQDVTVTLNDAGRSRLAEPGSTASVHVLVGVAANPALANRENPVPSGDFGWQQVLGTGGP